jgi:hypothetical protein
LFRIVHNSLIKLKETDEFNYIEKCFVLS